MNRVAHQRVRAAVFVPLLAVSCGESPLPPLSDPRIVWTAAVAGGSVRPSVDGSRVFFGDLSHQIIAVDRQTGKTLWVRRNDVGGGPGFQAGDGTTVAGPVVAIADAFLFGIDRPTGQQRWRFFPDTTTGFFSYIASDSATVYAGSGDGRAYAVDAMTGLQRWAVRVADDTGGVSFNPTLFRDTLYVGYLRRTIPRTGGLAALDASTGSRIWYVEFSPLQQGFSAASHGNAVFVNDLVIVASDGGEIIALERATGLVRWKAPRGGPPRNTVDDDRPLVVAGQVVVAGALNGIVIAYDVNTGQQLWTHVRQGSVNDPLASDGSRVFLVDLGGALVALDASDGKLAWSFGGNNQGRGAMLSAPIVVDGVVYVGGEKAAYALKARD
jgi:outer membrane protein assembly factor BamB